MGNEGKYKLAEIDYIQGMKYKEIADKYGVKINTVKSWKTRYKWSKEIQKSMHTKTKKVCTQNIVENTPENLTEKQYLFCLDYIRSFNATKAYQKAYQCDRNTAMTNGSRMLRNAKVKEEIKRLTEECLEELEIDARLLMKRIVEKYIAIAFSDINDFLEYGHQNGKNLIKFKDSLEVDGTIIQEISVGKDGSKIKLMDAAKAMQWLDGHVGMATEEQKERIELLKAKREQISKETEEQDEENDNIQSFLEATRLSQGELEQLFIDDEELEDENDEEKEEDNQV